MTFSPDEIRVLARAMKAAEPDIPEFFHGASADVRPTVGLVIYDFGQGISIRIHWSLPDPGLPCVFVDLVSDHPFAAQVWAPDFRSIPHALERAWNVLFRALQQRAADHRKKAADSEAQAQENDRLVKHLLGEDTKVTFWDRLETE